LQQLVVAPAFVVRDARLLAPPLEPGLLLGHEGVDEAVRLARARETERRIAAVPLLVDARPVHRNEQAGVRVVLRHRGDAGAVEREVRADFDVEEVDGLAARVDDGRTLPDRPAVVVAGGGNRQRSVAWPLLGPRPRERTREVLVVDLEHDLPVLAAVADHHPPAGADCPSRARTASG